MNLQQLPKAGEEDTYQIRSLFIGSKYVADEDNNFLRDYKENEVLKSNEKVLRKKIVASDFSNLEMRVMAMFSKDKNLLEMFESGGDTHSTTAKNMFNLDCDVSEVKKLYPHFRQVGKILNFLLAYGGGASTLYENLKAEGMDLGDSEHLKTYNCKNGKEVAQLFIDKYFESYSGVAKMIKHNKKIAHKNGFVKTILGRKRRLKDINSSDFKLMAYNERLSTNSVIQGCLEYNSKVVVEGLGVVSIGSLPKNTFLRIWNGEKFVKAWCSESGLKQKVVLKFNDKREIICSPEHQFLTINSKNKRAYKKVKDFNTLEKIVTGKYPDIEKVEEYVTISKDNITFTDEFIPMYDIMDSETHNFMVDGVISHNSAGDITMSAQNRISKDRWLEDRGIYVLLQVHDELVYECPEKYVEEAMKKVEYYMSKMFGDKVELPLEFIAESDFGDSYQDAK